MTVRVLAEVPGFYMVGSFNAYAQSMTSAHVCVGKQSHAIPAASRLAGRLQIKGWQLIRAYSSLVAERQGKPTILTFSRSAMEELVRAGKWDMLIWL